MGKKKKKRNLETNTSVLSHTCNISQSHSTIIYKGLNIYNGKPTGNLLRYEVPYQRLFLTIRANTGFLKPIISSFQKFPKVHHSKEEKNYYVCSSRYCVLLISMDLGPSSLCDFGYFLYVNVIPEHDLLHLETGFSWSVVAEVIVSELC